MKKLATILAVLAIFAAGAASAALVININKLDAVQVCIAEYAPCTTGDCSLMFSVTGSVSGDNGYSRTETLQFRADDASAWGGNVTQASNLFRKGRRALRKASLGEDTE